MSTRPRRKPTSTSNFGAGRRESHDASAFYERFTPPEISDDDQVVRIPDEVLDQTFEGDAVSVLRSKVPDNSVALVVTSPPYFAGKEYEEALGEGHVPGDYLDFLGMLRDVFAECVRVLEPGGRIAVNVANLGRKPYRSLSTDMIEILQDDLNLLLRGEIIWWKQEGATGSTAWGSFQSPANPVLRDLTERVVVASKGRFGRAKTRRQREKEGLPYKVTLSKDEFMEATTDVWRIDAESATRVGHPAPFPVLLPQRLIELYTYVDDVVLDPFMGSGTTGVAALQTGRHFLGCETDPAYKQLADARVKEVLVDERDEENDDRHPVLISLPGGDNSNDDFQRRAVREGLQAREIARQLLEQCGFRSIEDNVKLEGGVEVNFVARDRNNQRWYFDVSGAFTSTRPGLQRTDTLWKALGKAAVIRATDPDKAKRLVFLTTHCPHPGSAGDKALEAAKKGKAFRDAIEMLDAARVSEEAVRVLKRYSKGARRRPGASHVGSV